MVLQTLMEEKQLDFNQPLLSVRRFLSTVASENDNKRKTDKPVAKLPPLPAYKSELKSGPVSNPGTVPFVWEKTPGRPKDESKLQTRIIERPSIAPKLPPGRVSKVEQHNSDKVPKGTHTPVTQFRAGSTISRSQSVASSDNKVTKRESIKEIIQEKASSGSDDGDDTYQDALDTLSRTESFFMTCSVSGLSEWDDQEIQPSANFSTDQQARDYMLGRFLPAAKAMASETPQVQFSSKKPLVTQEQPRQVKKVVGGEKSRPLNQKWKKVLPHYAQDIGKEESEDESDDDDGSENYAPKVCGLFPRFCLLNPIPGLRLEDRVLNSPARGMQGKSITSHKRTAKEHARTVNYGKKSVDSQSGFMEKKDFRAIPEKYNRGFDPHRRGCSEFLSSERTQCETGCETPVVEKTLYVDSVQKVKSPTSCSSEMKGPTNHRGGDFVTLRDDSSIDRNPAIGSSFEDSKHLDIGDEKATLTSKSWVSHDPSRLICSDNSSNDMLTEITNNSNKIYYSKKELTQPGYQKSNLDNDLVLVVNSSPRMVECKKIESESQVSSSKERSDGLIQDPVSLRNLKLTCDSEVDLKSQGATKWVDQERTRGSGQDSGTLASSKVAGDGKIDFERKSIMKLGHRETSNANTLKLPLSLPLPKAPSESWLKRTLPAVSSRNISSRSNAAASIHARTQTPKAAVVDPKWEIIVKSSNTHNGHQRLSEELLAPIPEA